MQADSAQARSREIIDALMNGEIEHGDALVQSLEIEYPDYPLLGFIRLSTIWAKAESSYDAEKRRLLLEAGISQLKENIAIATTKISQPTLEHSSTKNVSLEWKLNLGLSQAFLGLAYMRTESWFKSYKYGRQGRDTLRELIKENPSIEDAYMVLGFYEYHTGVIPFYLAWLAALVDLSGDSALGLQYIHRSMEKAPLLSPEAKRLFLMQTETAPANACEKKILSTEMVKLYPKNAFFPWFKSQMLTLCPE
ncbi:MAG: hypothetical protein Q9M20_08380 [Mariprofundaceae bacterium]|nr:hypothetical protein [Mariprofundaceae bacterium]